MTTIIGKTVGLYTSTRFQFMEDLETYLSTTTDDIVGIFPYGLAMVVVTKGGVDAVGDGVLSGSNGSSSVTASNDGTVKLFGTGLEVDGGSGAIYTGTTQSKYCIPVLINGVGYYVRLSDAP